MGAQIRIVCKTSIPTLLLDLSLDAEMESFLYILHVRIGIARIFNTPQQDLRRLKADNKALTPKFEALVKHPDPTPNIAVPCGLTIVPGHVI